MVGASSAYNARYVDESWFNTFQVLSSTNKEVFSEQYQIKMKQSGELRVLRKIRKIVFQENETLLENFRFVFEEILLLDHPNLA